MGGAYITNLDEYESKGTHWIALYVIDNSLTYFDSFGVEHIPEQIKKFIENKNIIRNTYRIQVTSQYCVDTFVLYLLILC